MRCPKAADDGAVEDLDRTRIYRSRGLNVWLAGCSSLFLLIGLSMLLDASSTLADRLTGAVVSRGSNWAIVASLRRQVEVDPDGFVIRFFKTTRVRWDALRDVRIVRSGVGYGVRVRIARYRLPCLLPVGSFGKPARRDDSVVMLLARDLEAHLHR